MFWRKNKYTYNPKKYQPVEWPTSSPLGYAGWPEEKPRKNMKRTILRFAAALAILFVLLAAGKMSSPLGPQVQEELRYILTTEWNFQPAIQKVVQIGLQMVNENYPFYDDLLTQSRETLSHDNGTGEFLIPVSGKVVRGFGWSTDPVDGLERFHSGIDIQASPGSSVKASQEGKATRLGKDPSLGYFILLDHGEGAYTMYAGLAPVKIEQGASVEKGQIIGEIGTEGDIPEGGLHFELREKNKLVDPLTRLKILPE